MNVFSTTKFLALSLSPVCHVTLNLPLNEVAKKHISTRVSDDGAIKTLNLQSVPENLTFGC